MLTSPHPPVLALLTWCRVEKRNDFQVGLVCLIGVTNNWQVQTLPGITSVISTYNIFTVVQIFSQDFSGGADSKASATVGDAAWEDPLEKKIATHSSTLRFMGSQSRTRLSD